MVVVRDAAALGMVWLPAFVAKIFPAAGAGSRALSGKMDTCSRLRAAPRRQRRLEAHAHVLTQGAIAARTRRRNKPAYRRRSTKRTQKNRRHADAAPGVRSG